MTPPDPPRSDPDRTDPVADDAPADAADPRTDRPTDRPTIDLTDGEATAAAIDLTDPAPPDAPPVDAVDAWARSLYEPGGGDALVFLVAFGADLDRFAIHAADHRVDEIPDGFELVLEGPEAVEAFLEPPIGDVLAEDQPELLATARACSSRPPTRLRGRATSRSPTTWWAAVPRSRPRRWPDGRCCACRWAWWADCRWACCS